MTGTEVGILSIILIVVLIYSGLYVPVALGLVSFIGIWIVTEELEIPIDLLAQATADGISNEVFAAIPLFVVMGLLVSLAGMGRDIYDVSNYLFRRIRGGLGIATVAANAVFAAITGSSIASASVFTRLSVPEMRHHGYSPRFAVGVVAGSSILGMLIPPSAMLIIYAVIAEQSVGAMFTAGILPGILLSTAYSVLILMMAYFFPKLVMSEQSGGIELEEYQLTVWQCVSKMFPIVMLILLVLGGIYGGIFTPTEAGASGAFGAMLLAFWRKKLTPKGFWDVLVETGHISATILLLIMSASMYSRMLGITAIPSDMADWMQGMQLEFGIIMTMYVILLVFSGTILDTVSIILIAVPIFSPVLEPYGIDLVWFGIVTVIGAEIGLITPPLGISCFVVKSTIDDDSISLFDIFAGSFPFAVIMLIVLILVIVYPEISLYLSNTAYF
ncbi:MAG: TRAP transporter large permease subunit [SAR324 cluster bacterium]|nr:TRAP transporter large permease subunit [SAR324 cluster bacterium]